MLKPIVPAGLVVLIGLELALWGAPLFAQSGGSAASFPALDADPRAYEFNRRIINGSPDWQDLMEIALWASSVGASPAGGGAAVVQQRIENAAAEIAGSRDLPADPRERGEFILTFMYEKMLKAYSARQTRLDELFSAGRYNCVSSAVLYTILASAVGLDVRGVMTRDHAFVTVNVGTELIDVETTNAFGFNPGSRREFHDGFGAVTGFAYVPARNYRDRVTISQVELASLILSNRIADLESRGRYGDAVPLAINRAVLLDGRQDAVSSPFFTDPDKDLMDRLFNYGASLIKAGKESEALDWSARASARYPANERWQEFVYTALNNLMVKSIKAQRAAEARNRLTLHASSLSPDNFERLDALALDAELVQRSAQIKTVGEVEAFLETIDAVQSEARLPQSRTVELRTFALLKEAELLSAGRGAAAAVSFLEESLVRYGANVRLNDALRVFRSNRVVDIHNHFADLFNRGNYEEARRTIVAALEEFPGNRQLQSDLTMTEQALKKR
jgi:tetratricopeptide (TPR) repeat protein